MRGRGNAVATGLMIGFAVLLAVLVGKQVSDRDDRPMPRFTPSVAISAGHGTVWLPDCDYDSEVTCASSGHDGWFVWLPDNARPVIGSLALREIRVTHLSQRVASDGVLWHAVELPAALVF
jgi:hypothetical protein